MSKTPIRVLQIIADFKKGGVQADVMYPTRILNQEDVRFDVMLFSDKKEFYEDEFLHYGNIYRISIKKRKNKLFRVFSLFIDYFIVKRQMKQFLRTHEEYDAIHSRHLLFNAPCISAATENGVPVRIAHCHVNKPNGKTTKDRSYVKLYLKICARILNKKATHRFGVTGSAVEYMFGDRAKGIVVKNPTVDLSKFDPKKYLSVNSNEIKLIVVGSYSYRKNQLFAAEVLYELLKSKPESFLTFIGYPRNEKEDYFPRLKEYVTSAGMEKNVAFLPQDTNVAEMLSKSTIMLIPSLQEGLPNVALEAQAMGVPCFISSNVSKDCNCGICTFLPLSQGPKYWAEKIEEFVSTNGYGKHYVDMSSWDNKLVSKMYLDYWHGKPMKMAME